MFLVLHAINQLLLSPITVHFFPLLRAWNETDHWCFGTLWDPRCCLCNQKTWPGTSSFLKSQLLILDWYVYHKFSWNFSVSWTVRPFIQQWTDYMVGDLVEVLRSNVAAIPTNIYEEFVADSQVLDEFHWKCPMNPSSQTYGLIDWECRHLQLTKHPSHLKVLCNLIAQHFNQRLNGMQNLDFSFSSIKKCWSWVICNECH